LFENQNNAIIVFLTYIPHIHVTDEFKTKPAQESIKTLLHTGLQPNIIMCRYEQSELEPSFINKISLYSNVGRNKIFLAPNVDNIYKLPYLYAQQGLHHELLSALNIFGYKQSLQNSNHIYRILSCLDETITINVVVKYGYIDAYVSLAEALKHAAYHISKNININWIDVRNMCCDELYSSLNNGYSILVPGGFGVSGVENKIEAIHYARTHNVPFLGICYGMQLMAVEFARNVLKIENATTEEIDVSNQYPHIVHIINEHETSLGGTMRLGEYAGNTIPGTLAHKVYGSTFVERHRHRYEINYEYKHAFEIYKFVYSGISVCGKYMEIAELTDHDFFVGVQFHPEFNTCIFNPNPILMEFVKQSYNYQKRIHT